MPKDADIGRALATAISAAAIGRIRGARFSYDPFLEADDLPEGKQLFIKPERLTRTRLVRSAWQKSCTLTVMLFVDQKTAEAGENEEKFIDRWLDDFDAVIELVSNTAIFDNLPVEVIQDERYDIEKFNGGKRLVCWCSVVYKLI